MFWLSRMWIPLLAAVAGGAGRQQRDEALPNEGWIKLGEGRVDGAASPA